MTKFRPLIEIKCPFTLSSGAQQGERQNFNKKVNLSYHRVFALFQEMQKYDKVATLSYYHVFDLRL
jgi:hypothetical protein